MLVVRLARCFVPYRRCCSRPIPVLPRFQRRLAPLLVPSRRPHLCLVHCFAPVGAVVPAPVPTAPRFQCALRSSMFLAVNLPALGGQAAPPPPCLPLTAPIASIRRCRPPSFFLFGIAPFPHLPASSTALRRCAPRDPFQGIESASVLFEPFREPSPVPTSCSAPAITACRCPPSPCFGSRF